MTVATSARLAGEMTLAVDIILHSVMESCVMS